MIYIQEFAVQLGDSQDHECRDKILGGKNYYGHLLLVFSQSRPLLSLPPPRFPFAR